MPLWPSISVAVKLIGKESSSKVLCSSSDFYPENPPPKTLAYLRRGRLAKDTTSHVDLQSGLFFPNRSAHNSVIVFAARLFREMGANPSLLRPIPVCPDSSVGWRNDVVPILGFRRRRLKPWRLTGWRVPASGFSFGVVQTCPDSAKPINLTI